MDLAELIRKIEEVAPLDVAASWDSSGMQVATLRQNISCLAVCLDPTPVSIQKALKMGAEMILSHHPLFLTPRLPSTPDALHTVFSLLFRNDAALYAAHTSLDVNADGPVSWLAEELRLQNSCVLEPVKQMNGQEYGFGLVGDLPTPLTPAALLRLLEKHISLATATYCAALPARIRRVAYCTGSGSSLLGEASASGADIFITGDVKYHTAVETSLCILDVGHHSLEEEMMRRLTPLLASRLPGVAVHFIPSTSPLHAVQTISE